MLRFKYAFGAAALALSFAVAGCNVLDAAYDEGGGNVETLVDDARHARADQRYDRAVELLEEAHAQDPANAVVRVELATTLMQREELSSVDLVVQVTDFILQEVGGEGSGNRSAGSQSSEGTCSWQSSEPFEPLDQSAFEAYQTIMDAAPVLRRVHELLAGSDGTVLPAALLALSPCEAIVDSEVTYDRDAAMAELVATFGGSRSLARTALQLNMVVSTLNAYTGIFEQPDLPVSWFIVDESRLGFCVEDQPMMDLLYERIDPAVSDAGRALFSLDLLIHDAGSEQLETLRNDALEMYTTFQEDISTFCD